MDLILASTSPYRKRLLERLGLPFECVDPRVDETARADETPAALSARLALSKARAVARARPGALVIGSDQVAALEGGIMGKPGNFERASAQLRASAGREVVFHTGVALVCAKRGLEAVRVEDFRVRFRALHEREIANYLTREQPWDCAGSFKAEGLGIALFEHLRGNDPTSLEGLPLITVTSMLGAAGLPVLADNTAVEHK